jgi:hypothetical protein
VTPKRWIDPSEDRPREGDLRIVRTKCGQVRAAKWTQNYIGGPWVYADRNGDGYDVVAVGVTWETRKRSGPSGKNTVKKQSVRIPDDLWSRFGTVAADQKSDRNTIVNQLVAEYCDRVTR